MSDIKEARRAARARDGTVGPVPGLRSAPGPGPARNFLTVASGENVVMTDSVSGRSWALGLEDGVPVWQPIAFRGQAERPPRAGDREAEE